MQRVLSEREIPEAAADLVAALADLDGYNLAHHAAREGAEAEQRA